MYVHRKLQKGVDVVALERVKERERERVREKERERERENWSVCVYVMRCRWSTR